MKSSWTRAACTGDPRRRRGSRRRRRCGRRRSRPEGGCKTACRARRPATGGRRARSRRGAAPPRKRRARSGRRPRRRPRWPGPSRFSPTSYRGYRAQRWEFLADHEGVLLHEIDTLFTQEDGDGYGVLVGAPAAEWNRWKTVRPHSNGPAVLAAVRSQLLATRKREHSTRAATTSTPASGNSAGPTLLRDFTAHSEGMAEQQAFGHDGLVIAHDLFAASAHIASRNIWRRRIQ